MSLIDSLRTVFQRAPAAGARKDPPMPDPTPQPPAPQGAPDVTAHLTALADAMRQLAESQKTLMEAVKGPGKKDPEPGTPNPSGDISGEPIGGQRPSAVVDYSRMSPVQQITLGLRDSRNNAPSAGAD